MGDDFVGNGMMGRSARDGSCLSALIRVAVCVCQRTERKYPRTGPGRRPEIPDWVIAVLIAVAVAARRKSKSAQYRYLHTHRRRLLVLLGTRRFPSRTTYFDRYRRAHEFLEHVLRVHSEEQVRCGQLEVDCLAADRSLIESRDPLWHRHQRRRDIRPAGIDAESTWTYSTHHGWVQGYGYEVVVTAEKRGPVWPVLGSLDPAHWRENRTFPPKSTTCRLAPGTFWWTRAMTAKTWHPPWNARVVKIVRPGVSYAHSRNATMWAKRENAGGKLTVDEPVVNRDRSGGSSCRQDERKNSTPVAVKQSNRLTNGSNLCLN